VVETKDSKAQGYVNVIPDTASPRSWVTL